MNRVPVEPRMLTWARERAGRSVESLAKKFPKLAAWEAADLQPTLKQLEAFARAVHVPIAFLFLQEPPEEPLPIPDFRTIADRPLARPSPDLLDTLYLCQQRQDWYRDFARQVGEETLAFVGSARADDDVVVTAAAIREALGFDIEARREMRTWTDALIRFIDQADALGVLVMVSGVVGSNNRRRLDPEEFRGFALSDPLAPHVFINGADSKAAQMFTLAHELAHIWLGKSALSDARPADVPEQAVERWCNRVAAELLVPLDRTKAFALRIVRLYSALPKSTEAQVIGKQLLRSGTSVGAHVREAKRSRSNAEMISKTEGALQELEETIYWIELLAEAGIVKSERLADLVKEADELVAILVTSSKTLKTRKTT